MEVDMIAAAHKKGLLTTPYVFSEADARAMAAADPASDLANPLMGPFKAMPIEWTEAARAALELARIAGILPAFMVAPSPAEPPVAVSLEEIADVSDGDDDD